MRKAEALPAQVVVYLAVMFSPVLGLAADTPVVAKPSVTADIRLAEQDNRLYASVRVHGVEKGQVVSGVHLVWVHPAIEYTNKKGEVTKLFTDGGSLPAKGAWEIGDKDSGCYCKDTGEKGCWRTHADFLVEYKLDSGAKARAVGEWTVRLVAGDGTVLGTATYAVK